MGEIYWFENRRKVQLHKVWQACQRIESQILGWKVQQIPQGWYVLHRRNGKCNECLAQSMSVLIPDMYYNTLLAVLI